MFKKIRLGYGEKNTTLGITEYETTPGIESVRANIACIRKIIRWNADNNIYFFRMPDELCPGITALEHIPRIMDWSALAYDLSAAATEFAELGREAKKLNQRLTFHVNFHATLTSPKPFVVKCAFRELYWHAKVFDLMDYEGTMTMHLGHTYDNKVTTMDRFISNFRKLPRSVTRYIILENDEYKFNINDVLWVASQVGAPVCFDYFHYLCYNQYYAEYLEGKKHTSKIFNKQMSAEKAIKKSIESWGDRRPKFHWAEQKPEANRGAHAIVITKIPKVLRNLDIDLMLESRGYEANIARLRDDM